MRRKRAGEDGRDGARPAPKQRQAFWVPSLASLYGQVALRQENAYLSVGERCNANGSKRFRVLQESGDWDGCVAMGVEQSSEEQTSELQSLMRHPYAVFSLKK